MAFKPQKKYDELDLKAAIAGNSALIAIGDVIMPGATTHAPFIVPAINGTSQYTGIVLGVVMGIIGNGKPLEKSSITTNSDNETNAATSGGQVTIEYIPSYIPMDYVIDASADLGTTTGSDTYNAMFYLGYNTAGHFNAAFDVNGQIDETSVAAFTTQLHVFSYGAHKQGAVNATTGKYTQITGKFCPSKVV